MCIESGDFLGGCVLSLRGVEIHPPVDQEAVMDFPGEPKVIEAAQVVVRK